MEHRWKRVREWERSGVFLKGRDVAIVVWYFKKYRSILCTYYLLILFVGNDYVHEIFNLGYGLLSGCILFIRK